MKAMYLEEFQSLRHLICVQVFFKTFVGMIIRIFGGASFLQLHNTDD